MTIKKTVAQQQKAAEDLAAATVVLDLHFRAPGFRATVRASDVVDPSQVGPDGLVQLDVKKNLIDRKALKGINDARRDLKRWYENRTIDCGMLRNGMRLAPLTLVEEIVEKLEAFIPEDGARVEALLDRMEELKEQAKQNLGPQYHEEEYAPTAEIRAAYGMSYRLLSFNVPAALETQNKAIYQQQLAKVEAECVQAMDEIRAALREAVAGMFERMADRMGNNADGKPKVFRDTLVNQMQDFLSTFAARNLTGDGELADLMGEAKALLAGVTPDKLRKQETTRERVLAGATAILEKMDAAGMINRATRAFATDEEV